MLSELLQLVEAAREDDVLNDAVVDQIREGYGEAWASMAKLSISLQLPSKLAHETNPVAFRKLVEGFKDRLLHAHGLQPAPVVQWVAILGRAMNPVVHPKPLKDEAVLGFQKATAWLDSTQGVERWPITVQEKLNTLMQEGASTTSLLEGIEPLIQGRGTEIGGAFFLLSDAVSAGLYELHQDESLDRVTILNTLVDRTGMQVARAQQALETLLVASGKMPIAEAVFHEHAPRKEMSQQMKTAWMVGIILLLLFVGVSSFIGRTRAKQLRDNTTLPYVVAGIQPARTLAVSPDEKLLAIGWCDGPGRSEPVVGIYSLEKDRSMHRLAGLTDQIRKLGFDPSGEYVVAEDSAGRVLAWHVRDGEAGTPEEVPVLDEGGWRAEVIALEVMMIYKDDQLVHEIKLERAVDGYFAFEFAPEEDLMFVYWTGKAGEYIVLYDLKTGKRIHQWAYHPQRRFYERLHQRGWHPLTYLPKSGQVMMGSRDSKVLHLEMSDVKRESD